MQCFFFQGPLEKVSLSCATYWGHILSEVFYFWIFVSWDSTTTSQRIWPNCALKVSWFQNNLLVSSNLQKIQRNFSRISALASKRGSNQKIRALYTANWRILFWLLHLFLGQKSWKNYSLVFWKIWRHQKNIFEINWPLVLDDYTTTRFVAVSFFPCPSW